jgi:hypothetical protein
MVLCFKKPMSKEPKFEFYAYAYDFVPIKFESNSS